MDGKYIYGIINTRGESGPDFSGVESADSLHTIVHQNLGCVVSNYTGGEFRSMPKEDMVRYLLAHQMVVEHVMKEYTVLPVKFGTVLATPGEVRDLLSQGCFQFESALCWIQGKVEVEVAATWDTGQVLANISTEPEIVQARESASRKGQPTVEERIQLGQIVKAAMDRHRDSYRERMIESLKSVAVDVQPNALVSDELVMNVAFLVEKARQEEFDGRVKQLDELFHDQINFRIIGPLPPYSFATVGVTRPNPEEIEEARVLFGLGKVILEPEVRKAYRHLAAETHPDRKPGDEVAKLEFARLRQASDLLIACCKGQAESGGSLLINISRLKDNEVPASSFH